MSQPKTLGDIRQAAIDLCWQIEQCGASEELTKASVMASELHRDINELMPTGESVAPSAS